MRSILPLGFLEPLVTPLPFMKRIDGLCVDKWKAIEKVGILK